MKVFLTGATGFVGSYVLRELVRQGHEVRCLVRGTTRRVPAQNSSVEQVEGDLLDPVSLAGTMDGGEAVIHLVGILEEEPSKGITFESIHYEGTKAVANAALEAGIARFIHMSADGARPDGVSEYQRTKWKAEQYVQSAGFDHWTIFRPTLIFGDPGPDNPEFASRIARLLVKPFPILPVFGKGDFEVQPISIDEVSRAFVQALTKPHSAARIYPAGGPEVMTYTVMLDRITEAVGHAVKRKLHVPMAVARASVKTLGRTGLRPITPDPSEMLVEGNTCDHSAFFADFDVSPTRFAPENLSYLRWRR